MRPWPCSRDGAITPSSPPPWGPRLLEEGVPDWHHAVLAAAPVGQSQVRPPGLGERVPAADRGSTPATPRRSALTAAALPVGRQLSYCDFNGTGSAYSLPCEYKDAADAFNVMGRSCFITTRVTEATEVGQAAAACGTRHGLRCARVTAPIPDPRPLPSAPTAATPHRCAKSCGNRSAPNASTTLQTWSPSPCCWITPCRLPTRGSASTVSRGARASAPRSRSRCAAGPPRKCAQAARRHRGAQQRRRVQAQPHRLRALRALHHQAQRHLASHGAGHFPNRVRTWDADVGARTRPLR